MTRSYKRRSIEERFWKKVQRLGPDECWVWFGAHSDFGHGRFNVGPRNRPAHAISWEWHHKRRVPVGLYVLHTCDNPPCVNPLHLFIGTQKDNIADMIRKDRGRWPGAPGERNRNAKVTKDIVAKIRKEYARGDIIQTELGKKYGLSQAQVSKITLHQSWVD